MPISLLTLNCEEDKHLDLILTYLKNEQFDVVCLQEVFEENLEAFCEAADANSFYAPLATLNGKVWGIAILVQRELLALQTHKKFYKGQEAEIPAFTFQTPNAVNRAILNVKCIKMSEPRIDQPITSLNFEEFSITTTHFTWAGGGGVDQEQLKDFPELLKVLDEVGKTILCGDFNAPRGKNPIFDTLAEKYADNIPNKVSTTIDQELHRAKGLQLVVDGLFSSDKYRVNNVQVISNLSDHCGIRGEVYLNEEILL